MSESLLGLLEPGVTHFGELVITKLLELVEVVHVVRLFDLSVGTRHLGVATTFVLLFPILALSNVLGRWFSNGVAEGAIDLALPLSWVLETGGTPKRQRSLIVTLAFD